MLACAEDWTLDNLTYMSKEADRLDCECTKRLRECRARSNRLSKKQEYYQWTVLAYACIRKRLDIRQSDVHEQGSR